MIILKTIWIKWITTQNWKYKRLRQIDNHGQIKIDNDTFYNYEKKVIIRNNEEFNLSK